MASALFFNENDGYIDGILRGYFSGILKSTQYLNFTQCETLEGMEASSIPASFVTEELFWRVFSCLLLWIDLRLQLGATDYGTLLQNEPSPIATSTISERLTQRLVEEFNYIRANAVEPLSKFLDYITHVFYTFVVSAKKKKGDGTETNVLLVVYLGTSIWSIM